MKDQLKYYNRKYPLVDEMVMIRIDSIGESCVNVTLMEYDMEGIIVFKELWNRRLRKRNLRQAAPIGRTVIAQVMTADSEEGDNNVITLTKKRITQDEIKEFSSKYSKNKQVISMIENISHTSNSDFEYLMKNVVHSLNEKYVEDTENEDAFDSILDLFEEANTDNDFEFLNELEITSEVKNQIIEFIKNKFKPEVVKVSAKIALLSSSIEGINLIKNVLQNNVKENPEFNFYLDKTPYYIIEINTDQQRMYNKKLESIINNIKSQILSKDGQFKLVEKSY